MALDFPSNPVDGQIYDNFYWDESFSAWRATGNLVPLVPPGVISQYAGSTAPGGYLLCTGQSLLVEEYPLLHAAIGYQYGGSGLSFNVPNLQNRVPVGKGTEVEFDTLGESGGSKTHQLSVNEMPSHTHIQDSHNHTQNAHSHTAGDNGHSHSGVIIAGGLSVPQGSYYGVWGNYGMKNTDTGYASVYVNNATATNQATTATNQNTGGGLAHNNLQPYIVLNYIIKT